ncbi:MAG: putative ATP-grasp-modified RiPP [Pseudonocardiaceae bacterium]
MPTQNTEACDDGLPFALRYAVTPNHVVTLDLETLGYDEQRQIGVVREGAALVPLLEHPCRYTLTGTAANDSVPGDSDED